MAAHGAQGCFRADRARLPFPTDHMKTIAALLVALSALPVGAQAARRPAASLPTALASAHELWKTADSFILSAAEEMPESRYGYRPTPDVRSFGEVVLHVSGAHYLLCGIVRGEKEKDIGKPTAKADIVAALKLSIQYCDVAYAISDADAMKPATVFDQPRTNLHALMTNAWHDNEHYGNITTYMRLQGMVPPSSQPKK